MSNAWVVNQVEKARIVGSLKVGGLISTSMPIDDVIHGTKGTREDIIKTINRERDLLKNNITQEDYDSITIPQLQQLVHSRGGGATGITDLMSDQYRKFHGGTAPVGMDAIVRLYERVHSRSHFYKMHQHSFPYRAYYKTWDEVRQHEDAIDYLIIRHYEIFGIKLPSTNPKLFSNSVAPPMFGAQPKTEITPPAPVVPAPVVPAPVVPAPVVPAPVVPAPVVPAPDIKLILLGIVGTGLLVALIFILRGRN
jgi:hypothetical protein